VIADLKYAEALLRQNLKDREMASLQPNAGKPMQPLDKGKKGGHDTKKTGKKTS
jgi:hypothetical protein